MKENSILLETNRFDRINRRSYLFSNPSRIISCHELKDIKKAFLELEDFVSAGYYAAGFISYEAGFSFEESLCYLRRDLELPLLWFGIYKAPLIFTHTGKTGLSGRRRLPYAIKGLRPNISRKEYINDIKKIKGFIRKGDTYQVNYTFKYKFDFSGSISSLYEGLKRKQSVSYSAFIKTPGFSILSLSPELFFRKVKGRMEVRPMKGTLDRGRDLEEDRRKIKVLRQSLKDRSENVMIVDLLRNDLGRISRPGSVKTERLFEVERYETLLQMISVVRSAPKKNLKLYDLFKAIFPSGSVTGAPKINTMKIINSLEKEPRNIYTGSVGFFAPRGASVFNVAIRTLLINNKTGKGELGVGSGIVYDSEPGKEFEECRLKASFITQDQKEFRLIETMRWQAKKGYLFLKRHMDRLLHSAKYFNFKCNKQYIISELKELEGRFKNGHDYRVRILLDRDGKLQVNCSMIANGPGLAKVRFSDKKTSSRDISFYHKTTDRDLYDREYKRWRKRGYFDVIFTNEKNQITEGAISNIIIKKGKSFYTPPVDCGLLNGVFRQQLFERKKFPIRERILCKKDIRNADEVYMVNSVRGMVRVEL